MMNPKDFPEPQYQWIKVEVNYGPYYADGKDRWADAVGWTSLEHAKTCFPKMKFREKTPWTWIGQGPEPEHGYVPNYPPPLEGNENKIY
jgi:hypothetical protein